MRKYWFFVSTGLPTSTLSVISLEKKKIQGKLHIQKRETERQRGGAGWEKQKARGKTRRGEGTESERWETCTIYICFSVCKYYVFMEYLEDLLQYISKNAKNTTRAHRILRPTMQQARFDFPFPVWRMKLYRLQIFTSPWLDQNGVTKRPPIPLIVTKHAGL